MSHTHVHETGDQCDLLDRERGRIKTAGSDSLCLGLVYVLYSQWHGCYSEIIGGGEIFLIRNPRIRYALSTAYRFDYA